MSHSPTQAQTNSRSLQSAADRSIIDAVNRIQALVEFDLDGHVLHANERFLDCMGYTLEEIVGQHHRVFCTAEFAAAPSYQALWRRLGSG
ncbi:PAS domain-containing protein [Massilia glaciei]|uniref:PAS domain-containing protein n=1 Tax=Massilia glaciei TaxID=1524097 RepID=UPI001C62F1FD|nr:PAS domain-containing protein [Massilia glaciei]